MQPWPFDLKAHPGWRALREAPLVVLVGLTGVGKTTLAGALGWPTLPNRRELTDRYILGEPVADRAERFRRVAVWKRLHPGGVAELLARGHAPPAEQLLFDGLRGASELGYALEHLPRARFLVLEAPNELRLMRLLRRGDAFDRAQAEEDLFELAAGIVAPEAVREALGLAPAEEVRRALKIVAEEAKNYDPEAARRVLLGSGRACFLDARRPLEALVAEARRFLEGA